MWGSFKSYFGQYNQNEKVEKNETDEIEGWVFVDITGKEVEKDLIETDSPKLNCKVQLNPLPLLDISNTSSSQSSPQLSPTKIEEGWFVAPPPCFTLNCRSIIEISPLEDLLIEHPSMSVYSQIPEFSFDDDKSEHNNEITSQPGSEIKAEPRTMDVERDVLTNLSSKATTKDTTICTKSLDLKGLIDQNENVKPAQQAKWESDQYKLCPSYINRQNRVHRYQSRKHHNQKKKSIAKPFAEKGRHSF